MEDKYKVLLNRLATKANRKPFLQKEIKNLAETIANIKEVKNEKV